MYGTGDTLLTASISHRVVGLQFSSRHTSSD
jgi:hypothetical protein